MPAVTGGWRALKSTSKQLELCLVRLVLHSTVVWGNTTIEVIEVIVPAGILATTAVQECRAYT